MRLSAKHGVSIRGWFEACTIVALGAEDDLTRRDLIVEVWAAARRLEASDAYRSRPQRRFHVDLGDELAAALAAACQRHGVSMNAALAVTVMGTKEPAVIAYMAEVHTTTLLLARRLDRYRRSRKRLNPPLAVNT